MPDQYTATKRNALFIVLPYLVTQKDAKASKIRSFTAFPYGLLSVATYLKNNTNGQCGIKIIDCNLYGYDEAVQIIKETVLNYKPDVVGFSMILDSSYKYLNDISMIVKKNNNDAVIVLGGAAATFSYLEIIKEQDYVDGICYAEGEKPFLSLMKSENPVEFMERDKSWITRKSFKEGKPPQRSFVEDLDEVIDIDYTLVDIEKYSMKEAFSPFFTSTNEKKKQFFLVTSRGCPYKCVFCSTCSTFYGNIIRYASVDSIIAHVKHLVSDYGMNVLTIYDDQLLLNKKRAKEIFRQLAQFDLRIECPNGLSVAFIDDEMAALMRNAGLDTAVLAIESGSDYVLKEIINKPLKLKMIKPVIKILRKHGFFIQGFFVIGIPGETEKHRDETYDFIKDVQLDWSGLSLATPLRGSRLYDICIENGYIDKDLKIGEIEDKKYIIKTPELDPEYISRQTYLMNLDINFVNNYRMKIGDYKVAANCFHDVIKRYSSHAFAYYYLAKAQEALNKSPELIKLNMNKFHEIIENDSTWKEYSQYYNLNLG
jgi:radical SAM superfamily enzyme YgiQ (UPF0313 family)